MEIFRSATHAYIYWVRLPVLSGNRIRIGGGKNTEFIAGETPSVEGTLSHVGSLASLKWQHTLWGMGPAELI